MTDEEYLRACGWTRRSSGNWMAPKDASSPDFYTPHTMAEAVEMQLAEDRARHNFMLARSRRNGGFMFARDGAPVNVGEYGIEPGGAPMNASAAAIEALKMQRAVVTVKIGGEPAPRTWTLAEIEAAWYRAEETGRPEWQEPRRADDLRNSWYHVRGALTGEEV